MVALAIRQIFLILSGISFLCRNFRFLGALCREIQEGEPERNVENFRTCLSTFMGRSASASKRSR